MDYITDKEIDAIQGDMGETLRKQPRVRMRIEGSGYWEGGINGWFFRVRRGEETELPKSIAELIQRSEQVAVMGEREVKPSWTAATTHRAWTYGGTSSPALQTTA